VAAHVVKQHHVRFSPLRELSVEISRELDEEKLYTVLIVDPVHKLKELDAVA